ncbi:Vegetative incompatibility protein HET-E-1 [Colletotrichum siamense]|uniref:Vegetative incompatibility protein HET-E-1 n=1 Tax=Colletotrichum siamense TaxID=690259 RepID=A0A9P5F6M8_COLSI|nr:Vegetative incompatibility protein HET-E-1 [Colletotrichum siamense]KAF4867198.1 Vegetative incompatibility protein HET-E-1 [Colletotrichum siamense]
MSNTLRRDIYDLEVPGTSIDEIQPPHDSLLSAAGYSCAHWIDHFAAGSLDNSSCPEGIASIKAFLREHFLHWLEALSLLRIKPGGIVLVDRLLGTLERWAGLVNIQGVKREWDARRQTLEGHEARVTAIAYSPDGLLLASGSNDQTVQLWDAASGSTQHSLEGCGAVFAPNGQIIASASLDETVRIWEVATGLQLQVFQDNMTDASSLAVSPNGQVVVSGSPDKKIRLWEIKTGACHSTFEGHNDSVSQVVFSSDGRMIASGSCDKTIRMWNMDTGKVLHVCYGHQDSITAVVFSPDGRIVVSSSLDKTIRTWNVVTGKMQQTLNVGCSRSLRFDHSSDLRLFTDMGTLRMVTNTSPGTSNILGPTLLPIEFGLSPQKDWILIDSKKAVSIPPQYQPSTSAVRDSAIFIGCHSGCVLRIFTPTMGFPKVSIEESHSDDKEYH